MKLFISSRFVHYTFLCSLLAISLAACGDSDGNIEYAALGASDVVGIGASPPSQGYVFEIEDGLDAEPMCDGADVTPLGIPGAKAGDIENVSSPAAKELNPDLVTLWTGANDLVSGDSVEGFEEELNQILIDMDETQAQVFVANLPQLTQLPTFLESPDPDVTTARVDAYNAAIARQAAAHGAVLVDLFSGLGTDQTLVSGDGFHPNDAGHKAIAQLFLREILPRVCGAAQG